MNHLRGKGNGNCYLAQFLPPGHSQRTCILTFYPPLLLREITGLAGGNLSSSIAARVKSRSRPSNRKVLTFARITSVRRRLRRLPCPAPQRACTSWRIWCGDFRLGVSRILMIYAIKARARVPPWHGPSGHQDESNSGQRCRGNFLASHRRVGLVFFSNGEANNQ